MENGGKECFLLGWFLLRRLQGLLGPAVGRDAVLRQALAQRVLRHWSEVVGETLAKRSRPDRYENGTVWIAVEGSAWAQELRLAKPQLLRKLRDLAENADLFTDLRFGVRPIPLEVEEEPSLDLGSLRAYQAQLKEKTDDRSIREIATARLAGWPKTSE